MTRKGSVNAILLAVIAVLLVGGAVAGYFAFLKPPATGSDWNASENAAVSENEARTGEQPKTEADARACVKDGDCIIVTDGCCGCSEMGRRTAINFRYASYWQNKMNASCKDILCAQAFSSDWTCVNAKPKCAAGVCQLVKK